MSQPLHPEVAILNAVLELPASERAAYLECACAGHPTLRQQVESLLQSHAQAEGFLQAPLTEVKVRRTALDDNAAWERPGQRIGRYTLIQPIGEGGCGVVYLAEQEEPVRRWVALKVIKLGMDTKSVIARFEAERQALALMEHPNIAKVLDAGATETGRPYFVMELVRGMKITEYCERHDISTAGRLKLFIQVCQAIQHAHQKGVVHRDIKPSNILVTNPDEPAAAGVPKVIDFGIAKATQGRLTEQTLGTALEQFIGTPAYMSPEQAVLSGLDIDTRSDIYSLGVLLYELLTGRTPFDPKELLSGGMDEMRRTIREREPPKPSNRLSQLPAGQRPQAKELFHQLRGDLDWIVMKCLEKDRTRRYETANGLAVDIQRHLDSEPVNARPPSATYRFRKLVRRNRLAFGAAATVGVAALLALVVLVFSNVRIGAARRAEQAERQKSDAANRELRYAVNLLELERAEDFFSANDAASGVAHLTAMLRRDAANSLVAHRLISALTQRGWALPGGSPMQHLERVSMASFSPDGRRVLSASWDETAGVWDAADGRKLFVLPHEGRVVSARFSPNGEHILTASADGSAKLWHAATGAMRASFHHGAPVHWAEFNRDGTLVATGCADGLARIWDAVTGQLKRELAGHGRPVVIARFSPDSRLVATATDGGGLLLWAVDSGQVAFTLRGHQLSTAIETLAFSPDGRRLVSGGYDRTARLWDVTTGEALGEPLVHRLRVWQAEFSPDSRLLLTACEDGAARLWNVRTTRAVGEQLRHESGVVFGRFSPDGRSVVTTSSDNTARVWDVRTQTPLCQPLRYTGRVVQAGFSPDGARLVAASYYGIAETWELRTHVEPAVRITHDRNAVPVAMTADGAFVLTAGHDKTLRLWEVRSGRPASDWLPQELYVTSADFASDGRRAALAFTDHAVQVWDFGALGDPARGTRPATNPRIVAGPLTHGRKIHSVRFSPDGSRVVSASADGTARVWDPKLGQPVTPPLPHRGEVVTAQFSRDGSRVITASEDRTARIWDAQSGRPLTGALAHQDHVKWAEFSPDGESVVTASTDTLTCVWDARTGRQRLTLQHARIVDHVAFSPDGRSIATASLDRTAQLWDARTGQALTPPLRHDVGVGRVYFSANAQRLFTLTWNGSPGRVWDAGTGRPISEWLNTETSMGACFDASTGRVILGATNGVVQVWDMPEPPLPVPEWFLQFAEALAGVRLGARGNRELVSRSELARLRRSLPPEGAGDFYERLARRLLATPRKTPAASF